MIECIIMALLFTQDIHTKLYLVHTSMGHVPKLNLQKTLSVHHFDLPRIVTAATRHHFAVTLLIKIPLYLLGYFFQPRP